MQLWKFIRNIHDQWSVAKWSQGEVEAASAKSGWFSVPKGQVQGQPQLGCQLGEHKFSPPPPHSTLLQEEHVHKICLLCFLPPPLPWASCYCYCSFSSSSLLSPLIVLKCLWFIWLDGMKMGCESFVWGLVCLTWVLGKKHLELTTTRRFYFVSFSFLSSFSLVNHLCPIRAYMNLLKMRQKMYEFVNIGFVLKIDNCIKWQKHVVRVLPIQLFRQNINKIFAHIFFL